MRLGLVDAQKVAEILGLPSSIHSYAQLEREVAKRLPKKSLNLLVRRIVPICTGTTVGRYSHKVVPQATYNRTRELLSVADSAKILRIARVIALAEYVWENEVDARLWMNTPLAELRGSMPADAILTEAGAIRTEEVLNKILFGLPV